MKVVLISLLFIVLANMGCGSTKADSISVGNQEVILPENSVKTGDKKIKLLLTAKETTCKKLQSCKVLLDVRNLSDEDVELYGLTFLLEGYAKGKSIEPALVSFIDLETLANLGPNESGTHLTVKGKDHYEKEIDLEQIKWQEMRSNIWKQYDLWKFINSGEYRVQARVGNSLTKYLEPQTEKIGETEIQAVRVIPGADPSEYLALEFKEN